MKVQIGDVWESKYSLTYEIFCSWEEEEGVTQFGYKWANDYGEGMGGGDAERVMRECAKLVKRGGINRPGAGCECQRHIALVFGICTGEEFDSHNAEIVVLDSEGKLPKVEEKGYVDCPDTIERCKAVRYAK